MIRVGIQSLNGAHLGLILVLREAGFKPTKLEWHAAQAQVLQQLASLRSRLTEEACCHKTALLNPGTRPSPPKPRITSVQGQFVLFLGAWGEGGVVQ